MNRKQICIIGAGNGGSAVAGDMTLAGHSCRLFEFPEYAADNLKPIIASGGIKVTGIARTGFAKLTLATSDLAQALDGADLVMVCTQSLAHERVARELAPHLKDGQSVFLWPGSGGSLVARKVWDELGFDRPVTIAEGGTFPYCCRRLAGPGTVNIHRIDGPRILLAALPATDTPKALAALVDTYAKVVAPAASVIDPAISNTNIIVHPVGALLNMGRIEFTNGDFWMYKEGLTPSVKKVAYAMDAERMAVLRKLGYKPRTYDELFTDFFGIPVSEFAAASSKGPFSMQDRYVTEDIPMGACLTASLGRKFGVPTPTYDCMIHLASVVNNTDFYKSGRTLENLGLSNLTLKQLDSYLHTGRKAH